MTNHHSFINQPYKYSNLCKKGLILEEYLKISLHLLTKKFQKNCRFSKLSGIRKMWVKNALDFVYYFWFDSNYAEACYMIVSFCLFVCLFKTLYQKFLFSQKSLSHLQRLRNWNAFFVQSLWIKIFFPSVN